jgi:hypothetical protein
MAGLPICNGTPEFGQGSRVKRRTNPQRPSLGENPGVLFRKLNAHQSEDLRRVLRARNYLPTTTSLIWITGARSV